MFTTKEWTKFLMYSYGGMLCNTKNSECCLNHSATWMNVQNIILNKGNHTQECTLYYNIYMIILDLTTSSIETEIRARLDYEGDIE